MLRVTRFSEELIKQLADDGELAFTKTKDDENKNAPRFTVTLGVILMTICTMREGCASTGLPKGNRHQMVDCKRGMLLFKWAITMCTIS